MIIKQAAKSDLAEVKRISKKTISRCYRKVLWDEWVDWYINSWESDKEIDKHLENLYVLFSENQILWFTIFFNDLIHLMMVDSDTHRKWFWTVLLNFAEKNLTEKWLKKIRIETFEWNQQAINFYLKNNWKIIKKEKSDDSGMITVCFEKKLNN